MNMIRMILAAEMLKPVTPTVSNENKSTVTEYFPHLVVVHNKAEFTETDQVNVDHLESFLTRALTKSRLQWRRRTEDTRPHVVVLPDYEGERADTLGRRMKPLHNYEVNLTYKLK